MRFGIKIDGPTLLMSDAETCLRTAAGRAASQRLRHALRRAAIVTERVRDELIELAHLPDAANVVHDFLTKWVTLEKIKASVAYLTGELARAAHLDETDARVNGFVAALTALDATIAEARTTLYGTDA
jgi:hypothetical protein